MKYNSNKRAQVYLSPRTECFFLRSDSAFLIGSWIGLELVDEPQPLIEINPLGDDDFNY